MAAGLLSALSPATVEAGELPVSIGVTPNGQYVYVGHESSATINQYSRNSEGKLTALSPATVACGTGPRSLVVSPDGSHVYVANFSSNTVSQYKINAEGKLEALSTPTIATGSSPHGIAISADGKSVYVSNFEGKSISQYSRNAETGQLTALSPATVTAGTHPNGVSVSTDGKNVYCANRTVESVSQFSRNTETGALTELSPSTVATGKAPYSVIVSPDGKHAYVGCSESEAVYQYSRNAEGKLTALSPASVAAGKLTHITVVHPTGEWVYATNSGAANVSQYSRNAETGQLTALSPATVATQVSPYYVALSADGKSAYVANEGSKSVSQFSITAAPVEGTASLAGGGALSAIAKTPLNASASLAGSASLAATAGVALHASVALRGIGALQTAGSTEAKAAPSPLAVRLRERAPLRLSINVETPNGASYRWGADDPNPANVPANLAFSSAMPGGHERFSCVLERDPRLAYPDLVELSRITVEGVGGSVAWQGRLEKLPDTSGDQAQVTPEAVGYQAALEDDDSAREIYVDAELSKWAAASVARKIQTATELADTEDPSVGWAAEAGRPALITQIVGAWSRERVCEAWYDPRGIPLAALAWAWQVGTSDAEGASWQWYARLIADALGAKVIAADSGTFAGHAPNSTASNTVSTTTAEARWAQVQLMYPEASGADGVQYPLYWLVLAVYGRHGLALRGSLTASEWPGVLASDVVAHAIGKWAPEISFTVGSEGSIKPSSFVIPHLVFLEPTTVAEIIKQATRFELPDWAVWEGPAPYRNPTMYMNPRGERGKTWRARIGPSKLQEAGPQVSRLWNGVVVQYQDVTGITRMVGPPGFAGAESGEGIQDSALLDSDPENPLNQQQPPIKKWALLKMGTSTIEGAKTVGRIFLQEQKALESSGQATLTGHVEDNSGIFWPAWMVRAGDTISFVDARYSGPRTIVKAENDDSTKTCTVQLDQPPEAIQAILERLSVVLVAGGLG